MPSASNDEGHHIRGVLTAAGADGQGSVPLDTLEILSAHLAGGERAHGFERAHDRELLSLPEARLDSAGIDEDAGYVDARHRHHAARHVLVATSDAYDSVHALSADRDFDGVGNHFARYERILHPLRAHADSVGHGWKAEDLGHRAGLLQRCYRALDQRLDAGIAGIHRAVAVGHADDRLVEISVAEATARSRAVRRTGHALRNDATAARSSSRELSRVIDRF
jgi:hypothetical protein